EDTRSTVLAQLGTPSTKSLFDDNTWIYMSELQERIAFYHPKVKTRKITAISFGTDDKVE
ncbi:MAG: outer membrane protein assembly factor BamE, partial [Rhodobacterales bacterium]|nr:outer membrane protein assembly factor BamE [Rhodobacterales bacterium]